MTIPAVMQLSTGIRNNWRESREISEERDLSTEEVIHMVVKNYLMVVKNYLMVVKNYLMVVKNYRMVVINPRKFATP